MVKAVEEIKVRTFDGKEILTIINTDSRLCAEITGSIAYVISPLLISSDLLDMEPIATPDKIQFTDALFKTRSGKIVRRILTKIGSSDISNLGDTSTFADP